jgi:DNA-binding transcriptional regulator YdaS (Cro superfamily)
LALAVVRDLREHWKATSAGEPAQFETDVLSGSVLARTSAASSQGILATVLHQRKVGTHDLLANLFGVTCSTLSQALQEVRPLLVEHGHAITPSTARFRTPANAAALLTPDATQPEIKSACRISPALTSWLVMGHGWVISS